MFIKEELSLSDYLVFEDKKSKIDPSKTLHVEVGMICPRCKTALPVIQHGERMRCSVCHLRMENYGNLLICSNV
jgi:ribosomal protein S27AE